MNNLAALPHSDGSFSGAETRMQLTVAGNHWGTWQTRNQIGVALMVR